MVLKRFDIGRAGKVKGLTPKAECCMGQARQQKLLKNGRAKKRRLYEKMMNGTSGNKKSEASI